ncbi:nucleotidyl transferase AbiEii/AbiGii toxin family protein [Bradyrhizobium mercantei]|uniref:nucleotidyl transferase AbiEii/AbiGii toxin family protein n=1 Tax=Bradyrhizobium mercantei TaxID=1904807 RepID=UPI000976E344|nr:nucleotidyl transferase AbiEii/AbiGii toxin family protein [Bradyrhizobium mercantei]
MRNERRTSGSGRGGEKPIAQTRRGAHRLLLHFTLRNEAHLDEAFLRRVFAEIGGWIYDETGIEIPADQQEFEILKNPRGNLSCQGKISYKGPVSPTRSLPRVKLDLTADERVVLPPETVEIFHPYSDAPEEGIEVLAYDYVEAFAEKFRALAERTRPRDLYDVVNLYRNADARPEQQQFVTVLREKCAFKGIQLPQLVDIEPHRGDVEAGWSGMLNHQLPALLPIVSFWDALPEIFRWLHGQVAAPVLPTMPLLGGAGAEAIRERIVGLPPGSHGQTFIETIRFAAANRLLVNLDYRDQQGKRSTRAIEAYSLRRSRAGDVLLMAVRADSGQPRSYRLDSILGVSQTQTTFSPRYPIELTPTGPQSIPLTSRPVGLVLPRASTRRRSRASSSGTTYVFRCTICGKLFERKSHDSTLRPHKNRAGYQCYGTYGTYVRTK